MFDAGDLPDTFERLAMRVTDAASHADQAKRLYSLGKAAEAMASILGGIAPPNSNRPEYLAWSKAYHALLELGGVAINESDKLRNDL